MREAAVQMPSGSALTLALSAREGTVPPDLARRFPLRLDLILDAQEGWFTVLKDSELDLTQYARDTMTASLIANGPSGAAALRARQPAAR